MMKKTSQGRKKLEMVKIPKKSNLQVTFSKRRSGLFKKASELCTLCGVEIAIVVFSPADKPFAFGHPNFDSVVAQYLAGRYSMKDSHYANIAKKKSHFFLGQNSYSSSPIVEELNERLGDINGQLESERKRGQALDEMRKNSDKWWESPLEELSLKELAILKSTLEEFKNNVALTKEAFSVLNGVNFETNNPSEILKFNNPFSNVNYTLGFGNGVF